MASLFEDDLTLSYMFEQFFNDMQSNKLRVNEVIQKNLSELNVINKPKLFDESVSRIERANKKLKELISGFEMRLKINKEKQKAAKEEQERLERLKADNSEFLAGHFSDVVGVSEVAIKKSIEIPVNCEREVHRELSKRMKILANIPLFE